MKKITGLLLILLALILTLTLTLCTTPTAPTGEVDETVETVASKSVFDIPTSMTGSSVKASKEISQDTRDTIDNFFNGLRDQIAVINFWAQTIKTMISVLEAADVFNVTQDFTGELTGDNAGDKIKWTVGPGANEYLLEWWKKQADSSFEKYVEMKFTHYTNTEAEGITVRGHVIVDVTANTDVYNSPPTGYKKNPDMVKVEFDSEKADIGGKRCMKISMTNYQLNELDPTKVEKASDYGHNAIIVATKDTSGMVTVSGSTSLPGLDILTYLSPEYEYRYYVYVGKGDSAKATLNLGTPKDNYSASTVFATFENTIGGVITEYIADMLRANADFNGTLGHSILTDLGFSEPFENDTPLPSTSDIRTKVNDLGQETVGEDLYTLMNVVNPVYLKEIGYEDFGDTPPDTGYPTASDLPGTDEIIIQSEVDDFDTNPITFEQPGDDPGF